ncbi:MAG: PAS domain-containing protein [Steroidobacteraceae bacterium]
MSILGWLRPPGRTGSARSVRSKLMVVVVQTTGIALLLAAAAMSAQDLTAYRQARSAQLETEASILALATAPALAFDDRAAAERGLAALRAHSAVLAAALYGTDGRLFARYVRAHQAAPPARLATSRAGAVNSGENVELTQRIVQNGEWLGTIYLRARFDMLHRVVTYLEILGLLLAMSMIVALVLSSGLQRAITAPLDAMARVARQVVHQRDYSLRAQRTTDDEIGVVVEAFNRMLDEVQSRTRALEQSNSALQEEVRVRQAAQLALARANARLESTMAAAEIGSWVWDLATGEVSVDRNVAALFGADAETSLSADPALHRWLIHPHATPAAAAAAASAQGGVLASTEYRVVRPDGMERWVVARGKVQLDAHGEPVLLAGVLIDMTARKQAELALRDSERRYRAIGESIQYGVWLCDAEGQLTYASESFLSLLGMTHQQCAGGGWAGALHPEEAAAVLAAWSECMRAGGPWYCEYRVRGADGAFHSLLAQGVAIRGEDGRITGWAGINLDISRLKRSEEALREADRRKDEFLATLAHELRNPLAPIRNAAQLLEVPNADEHQRQWARQVIARQVQRMGLLLDDLLDVSRITRGRLELKRDRVSLAALVATAIETARPLIDGKQHTLQVTLPPEPIELLVDPLRMSQAISNLLNNAAKYTDARGHITLSAQLAAGELHIGVADTGIGFDPAALPKLFEMFSQIDSPVDRTEGGLGIGLALVKGLVTLHNGAVEAASAGPGTGSTFTIRLPGAYVLPRRSSDGAPAPRLRPEISRGCKVLIADDNRDSAESLALVMRMWGYQVCVAHSGTAALQVGARERPEAFILDIGMPGMSGYDVARAIRAEPWGGSVLLLAVTGWGQYEDVERALQAGFDEHMTKPVDPARVDALLSEYTSGLRASAGGAQQPS